MGLSVPFNSPREFVQFRPAWKMVGGAEWLTLSAMAEGMVFFLPPPVVKKHELPE
jgi:hypothetical protein